MMLILKMPKLPPIMFKKKDVDLETGIAPDVLWALTESRIDENRGVGQAVQVVRIMSNKRCHKSSGYFYDSESEYNFTFDGVPYYGACILSTISRGESEFLGINFNHVLDTLGHVVNEIETVHPFELELINLFKNSNAISDKTLPEKRTKLYQTGLPFREHITVHSMINIIGRYTDESERESVKRMFEKAIKGRYEVALLKEMAKGIIKKEIDRIGWENIRRSRAGLWLFEPMVKDGTRDCLLDRVLMSREHYHQSLPIESFRTNRRTWFETYKGILDSYGITRDMHYPFFSGTEMPCTINDMIDLSIETAQRNRELKATTWDELINERYNRGFFFQGMSGDTPELSANP